MKTLTDIGIIKLAVLFADRISHATYIADNIETQVDIFKKNITHDTVEFFVYLDDSVVGHLTQISLIDLDGDIIAKAEKDFIKPEQKGLYSVFKYKFAEILEQQEEG